MKRLASFTRFGLLVLLTLCTQFSGASLLSAQDDAADPISKIDQFLESLAERDQFSGAVLVAQDGEILLSEGYGMANLEWDVPNTPASKFRIGSITKQFTAMGVLLLQEQGALTIQDPICTYIEDCPDAWAEITIEQLMNHTSGIHNFTEMPEYMQVMMQRTRLETTIERFRDLPLDFEPGESWYYSNSGYLVLGHIIEEVSGQSYARFLKETIFDPLGMADTGYDNNQRVIEHRTVGYVNASQIADYIDMSIPHAAGALYSTVGDLYAWITALMNGDVVPQAALDAMWEASVPIPDADGMRYAYGLASYVVDGHTVIGHDGGINGFVSTLNYFPDDNVTIIALSNFESASPGVIVETSARFLFEEA